VQDVDIPTAFESRMFRHWTTKLVWLAVHPVIHGIRPYVKNPTPVLTLEIVNLFVQIGFDLAIIYFFGIRWKTGRSAQFATRWRFHAGDRTPPPPKS